MQAIMLNTVVELRYLLNTGIAGLIPAQGMDISRRSSAWKHNVATTVSKASFEW